MPPDGDPADREWALLRCCARVRLDPPQRARLAALLEPPPDWERLIARTRRHRLLPLLARHLLAEAPGCLPAEIAERLRTLRRERLQRNLYLAGALRQALDRLALCGILAVPLKGPALALRRYGDLSLRPMSDLDLLLRPGEVPRAEAALAEAGFQPELRMSPLQRRVHFAFEAEYNMRKPEERLHIELHWRFLPAYLPCSLEEAGVWERLERLRLGGREVPVLSTEDELLALCLHGVKHFWAELGLVCDVAEALRGAASGARDRPLDWDALLRRAERLGCRRSLLLGLRLARDLLAAPLPSEVAAAAAAAPGLAWLAAEVARRMQADSPLPKGAAEQVRARLFHLRTRERLQDRARYLACLAALAVLKPLRLSVATGAPSPAGGTPR